MNPIDQNNLDKWMFEYLEGNLGADDQQVLEAYLAKSPSAQVEFEAWKSTYLKPAQLTYPHQQRLIRPVIPVWGWLLGAGMILVMGVWSWALLRGPEETNYTQENTVHPTEKVIPAPMTENVSVSEMDSEPEEPEVPEVERGAQFEPAEPPAKPVKDLVYTLREPTAKQTSAHQTIVRSAPAATKNVPSKPSPEVETPLDPDPQEPPFAEDRTEVSGEKTPGNLPLVDTGSGGAGEEAVTVTDSATGTGTGTGTDPGTDPQSRTHTQTQRKPTVKVPGKSSKRMWKRRNKASKSKRKKRMQLVPIDGDAF